MCAIVLFTCVLGMKQRDDDQRESVRGPTDQVPADRVQPVHAVWCYAASRTTGMIGLSFCLRQKYKHKQRCSKGVLDLLT